MGNEILGDDEIDGDADILGAVLRRDHRASGAVYSKPPLTARAAQPRAKLRSFVGFGAVTWAALDGADKTLVIEPQETYRAERLVIDQIVNGAFAGIVVVRRIEVGSLPQSPSTEQPAPASMFARDATNADLDLQIARPGVKITLTLGVTAAPPAGVTVTAAAGSFGEWVR